MNSTIVKTMPGQLVAIAVAALIVAAARPAQAVWISPDYMPTATPEGAPSGWSFGSPYVGNGFDPSIGAALIDGNLSFAYATLYLDNTVNYDLGAAYDVNEVGVQDFNDNGLRHNPTEVILNFYTDNTFTTLAATRTVPLADQLSNLVQFERVPNAQFVQFDWPANQYYASPGSDLNAFAISEIQLFDVVPEPSTVLLLAAGGGLLWRRMKK